MRAAKRKHRVYIDVAVDTREAGGGYIRSWSPLPELFWAFIKPMTGRELTTNAATVAIMDTLIALGWSPTLATVTAERHRIRHGGTVYNIVSVADVEMAHREIEALCKSGAEQG